MTDKTLPRQVFGNLQSKLFPAYFALQTTGSLALLGLWVRAHHTGAFAQNRAAVMNAWLVAGIAGAALGNLLVVGPWTTGIMMERHRLEREEKTTYESVPRTPEMEKLNKRFAVAHSVSSILNLGLCAAAALHTMWIAEFGSSL